MPIDRASLPNDPAILQQMLVDLTAQLDKTNRLLRQLLDAKHATRSERLNPDQLHLFLQQLKTGTGAEEAATAKTEETGTNETGKDSDNDPTASGSGESKGAGRGRRPLAPHLKRERIEHDLSAEEKHCADCQQDLHCIGEETSERYEYIPAKFVVIEDVCKKYACECTVKTATKPPQPIAKSTAGASLLAQVIVSKIGDHLPVHRQGKMYARLGVEIADQTMCGWLRQSAEMLMALYGELKKFVLSSKVTGTDDTAVRVLDPKLKGTTRKGRFWPYTGDREHPGVVYDYTPTRERAGPEEYLKGYRGHLQADAYSVYDSFFTDPKRGLVEVACWAHTRRHFHDALETDSLRMGAVLAQIAKLYAVEKTAREAGVVGEGLRLMRQQGAVPVLEELHGYLMEISGEVLPKSEAGKAVAYALKNWTALTRYTTDGDLAIDNNHTERSIRGIAVGRNNWLFVGSDRGGTTMAVLRSFVSTCELVKVDPLAWFTDVLGRIGEHSLQRLGELLPHRWAAARVGVE